MPETHKDPPYRLAGYGALIERYRLEVMPNWHRSLVGTRGVHRVESRNHFTEEIYPSKYWPGDGLGDHLEFALKYDGTNLAILRLLFEKTGQEELLAHIQSRPTGKYSRRLWFLYEFLTGERLPIEDLDRGNYVDLLDPDVYYTVAAVRPVRRQRINDNLFGDRRFCPTVRRTPALREFEAADLAGRCRRVVAAYAPELLNRAMGYLYAKETKSSFAIEQIRPGSTRIDRFVALLKNAEEEEFYGKPQWVRVQNRVVDARYIETDYRSTQNYVGETVAPGSEIIHFIGPKPEDLEELMDGLRAVQERLRQGEVPPVIQAAVIAYGFVFLHPFEDGNGRIHRFLIHNLLARRGFTPRGVVFPVSAYMLKNPIEYDDSLEAFSMQIQPLVDYSLDEEGRMTVRNDTAIWYRYLDLTVQTEALFRFVAKTIDTELSEELTFLARYDRAKKAVQRIVDLPDRQIDLFIRFCLQNRGRLAGRKRSRHFEALSDKEIIRLERIVQKVFTYTLHGKQGGKP